MENRETHKENTLTPSDEIKLTTASVRKIQIISNILCNDLITFDIERNNDNLGYSSEKNILVMCHISLQTLELATREYGIKKNKKCENEILANSSIWHIT